jgi:hypothetical protein
MENRKKYMNWLGNRLGFTEWKDWYKIKGPDFDLNYGGGLMRHYHDSPSAAVMHILSEHVWNVEKFCIQKSLLMSFFFDIISKF